ncbi:hypothetical protein [Promicromonospora sp. NPDC090134]|uniref:hypothetical protein n=1 Tax=Promicromonospora sp. NPDC090134 TaxID=3364408 RepID=UPI003806B2AC
MLGGDVLQDEVLVVSESYVVAAVLAAISCWAWRVIVLRIRRAQLDLASAEFAAPLPSNDVGRR